MFRHLHIIMKHKVVIYIYIAHLSSFTFPISIFHNFCKLITITTITSQKKKAKTNRI